MTSIGNQSPTPGCFPTDISADIDIPALRKRYRAERDKRLRADGSTQYLELTADLAAYSEVDPHSPFVEREPLLVEADVLILGGEFAGLLTAVALKSAGVEDIRIIEMGGATEISRRYAIDTIEGRTGVSLFDHWRDGYKTLHGMSSHGFPNLFSTGFSQGGVAASNTAMYEQQGEHIAYIVSEALARAIAAVEPSQSAQDDGCRLITETAVANTEVETSCTPGYYNNEGGGGGEGIRSHLGEPYGPGFYAFGELLAQWRATGNMEGMELRS